MKIYIKNHAFHYELENLTRVFFPNEKIAVIREEEPTEPPFIYTSLDENITVKINFGDHIDCLQTAAVSDNDENERLMASLLFELLKKYTGITPPWGILTGVRPIKLMRRLAQAEGSENAHKYFREKLMVSEAKTALAARTEGIERELLSLSRPDSFSLYISIPFCPTRCSYCSFVSQSVEKAKHLMQPYTELLCRELEFTAELAKSLKLRLETVYMGGGTPTALSAEQISQVLKTVRTSFDMSTCREFTVEAGRPDTVTEEKLAALLENGVDRISINPQTLNDSVLKEIGRSHTAKQAEDAFILARQSGFKHINTDLIAGLPTDTFESFKNTLDRICALSPESITLHTLSMKKSSFLTGQGLQVFREDAQRAAAMLRYCEDKLTSLAYRPYYLYRQSRMVGNLENVGWAKPGFEGLYNVYVMDETHTVLACGAGAVTKLKQHGGEHIERIFNYKYPYEYNNGFEEILSRKAAVYGFYEKYPIFS